MLTAVRTRIIITKSTKLIRGKKRKGQTRANTSSMLLAT